MGKVAFFATFQAYGLALDGFMPFFRGPPSPHLPHAVILFVPLAFTGVCTDELCKVTGLLDEYKKLGADVIAISVDSPFAQEAWAKSASIGVTLASDFNRVAVKAFKVKDTRVIPEKTGLLNVAKRSVFVADKNGLVVHSEVKRDPSSMPNFAKIKKAVEA